MRHALIVDDHPSNIYYLQALLEGHGFRVTTARHGAEALVKARMATPDVVVSDLLMPVMDGYTLLRHWRADPRLKHVPFVVYTATYTEEQDEKLALALGSDSFILKPSEPEAFMAKVLDVLDNPKPAREMVAPGPSDGTLELYSQTLIRKLEEKSLQLEEANRSLQQEQAELQLRDRAIRAVSQGIVITDPHQPDNPIIYASPSFSRLTGYSVDEALGKNCRFLQGPKTDPSTLAQLGAAIRGGQGCTVEFLNYRKDGTPFWNSLTVSPVLDPDGKLLHFVGVQTDVTARRELESQLHQAQKMEAIGQLAAGVAHDFNNIVAVILGYTSMLVEQFEPGSELREDIEQVRDAGDRARDLVLQLLAISRRQTLEPRIVDVGALVLDLEKMLKRLLTDDIELSLQAPFGTAHVHADPTQIEQVLINLVINARDAMPDGGKLSVDVQPVDLDEAHGRQAEVPAGAHVMLAVSDTGVGMPLVVRERIFEPFFTTKELGKGTGLGLSTVFGIVKQSQGQIGVCSEPGQGTTFTIHLPRLSSATGPSSPPLVEPNSLGGHETILVVEDNEHVRAMLCRLLRRSGYDVLSAQNAGEAILASEQHLKPIHLLLTDVMMPRLNGRELAERLMLQRPQLRVLFMSGHPRGAVAYQALLESGVWFVPKPIAPQTLLRKLREVLTTPR